MQPHSILCSSGSGNFESEFRTGVKVHIGAAKDGALATRSCTASLSWGNQALVVASNALDVDLDAFGTDFGDGVPVAAFQIKKEDSCCVVYEVYSLQKPPRLLKAITGGEFFSASDLDLDGAVEIFTNDAAAIDGFDKLTLGEMDSPPSMVLRLANAHLEDVSAEFQPYFDEQIRSLRAGIDPHDLDNFRNSDGTLTEKLTGSSPEQWHQLRTLKIKVLEIVWAYLYSGREQEGWRSLAAMWPPADFNRIRAALLKVRASGIQREVDSTHVVAPARHKKKHAQVFDAVNRLEAGNTSEVVPPEPILLQRPPVSQRQGELLLELVLDRAGKVRSAEPVGRAGLADPELISAARAWKFIPAFKNGEAVASRVRIAVSPRE